MELNLLTKKQIKMTQTFNDILATLENNKSLEVDKSFSFMKQYK